MQQLLVKILEACAKTPQAYPDPVVVEHRCARGARKGARAVSGQIFGNAVSRHDIAAIWVAFFSRCQRYRCGQARLDASGALEGRPELRTLLGLDVDYHTEAWHLANPTPDNM